MNVKATDHKKMIPAPEERCGSVTVLPPGRKFLARRIAADANKWYCRLVVAT